MHLGLLQISFIGVSTGRHIVVSEVYFAVELDCSLRLIGVETFTRNFIASTESSGFIGGKFNDLPPLSCNECRRCCGRLQVHSTTLQELRANNKNTINLLTILADDYSEVAHAIVQTIDDHLHNVTQEQKLPTLYLTDSIVKNVSTPYKALFEKCIVKMFLHCFKSGDERVRTALHRLRLTWTEIFSRGKLYELDIKVNQEDPKWPIDTPVPNGGNGKNRTVPTSSVASSSTTTVPTPIVRPSTSNQKVHVNPKFMDKMAVKKGEGASPSSSSSSVSSRTVTVGKSNEVKVEVKPILKKAVAISARDPRAAKDPRGGGGKEKDEVKKVKSEPIDEPMPSDPAPQISMKKEVKVEQDEVPNRKDDRRKRSGEERKDKRREGSDRSPPPKNARRSPPRHTNQRQQRPISQSGPSPSSHIPSIPRQHILPTPPSSGVAPPTNVAGSHAFAMAPRVNPQVSPPQRTHSPLMYPPVSGPSPMPPHHSMNNQFAPIPGLLNPAFSAPTNPFGPNRGMGMPPPPMGNAPFMPPPNVQRPPPPLPERKHVFRDDNRLEGIPANNRIFVDGKAYEVLYIGQVAVIEKDGLPHKIYFQGVPRNVIIDGVAYMLGFGEVIDVRIDGDIHKIRFGAPSRELYMGDYPFKGAFGGAPIIATINGRRHEIRLSGPAPEVKIEPEPSYELSRFLAQARLDSQQQMQPRPVVQSAPPPTTVKVEAKNDLNDLLSKLKNSGIMNMLGVKNDSSRRAQSPHPLPIASDIRGGSDRAPAPLPLFEKEPFDMRLLKTRYDSVVSALLAKRSVCEQCGLRFDNGGANRYEKHLDWHVRKSLAASKTKETKSRAWYCSVEVCNHISLIMIRKIWMRE
ncbi:pcf-11 [Pristionchus pacificus]|uniref:Pcf-11 n=1 Tax=Pristionchus pacificus TaxID=54126 RepID=A0A2A6B458_PRIPA|nr:pcf-11 [Pristionchus pacificus]|eukprot:PDM60648.1 pcf-11 [Pristionchus pacificus]